MSQMGLLKGTLTKTFREQWNLLMRNKEENTKFLKDQGNTYPLWGGGLSVICHSRFSRRCVSHLFHDRRFGQGIVNMFEVFYWVALGHQFCQLVNSLK